jgi:hypothetical protein
MFVYIVGYISRIPLDVVGYGGDLSKEILGLNLVKEGSTHSIKEGLIVCRHFSYKSLSGHELESFSSSASMTDKAEAEASLE